MGRVRTRWSPVRVVRSLLSRRSLFGIKARNCFASMVGELPCGVLHLEFAGQDAFRKEQKPWLTE